jgi:hypothetical protein
MSPATDAEDKVEDERKKRSHAPTASIIAHWMQRHDYNQQLRQKGLHMAQTNELRKKICLDIRP